MNVMVTIIETGHRSCNANLLTFSQVPRELLNEVRGGEVHLTMEDHHHEDYVKPPTVIQPFGGQGHRLGWYSIIHQFLFA